mgnify:FL=1
MQLSLIVHVKYIKLALANESKLHALQKERKVVDIFQIPVFVPRMTYFRSKYAIFVVIQRFRST